MQLAIQECMMDDGGVKKCTFQILGVTVNSTYVDNISLSLLGMHNDSYLLAVIQNPIQVL